MLAAPPETMMVNAVPARVYHEMISLIEYHTANF
jgi:hypothetical protein